MSTHPNIPDDVAALISAHALGVLEPDQAALAEEHIAASDDCRRAYEDALETAAALALAVADSEPSADLRDRIVAAARAERAGGAPRPAPAPPPLTPRRPAHAVGAASPCSASPRPSSSRSSRSRSSDSADSARDREAALVSILGAPDARVVPMLPSGGGDAQGRVVVAQGRAAVVSAMARPPEGRTYQAWGLPSGGGAPRAAPDLLEARRRAHRRRRRAATRSSLVTVEPSGGSQTPSAAPIAAAKL